MVDLFDLCLWFGHVDTALALAMRGVEGCVLEDHHLGPFSRDSSVRRGSCYCQGRDTCRYCCWAFPVDQGIWMEDWDVDLFDFNDEGEPTLGAIPAAREAAAIPLTRAMLDLCSCDVELPFKGVPKGNGKAAGHCHLDRQPESCRQLGQDVPPATPAAMVNGVGQWGMLLEAARTALWAGADFEDSVVQDRASNEEIPFPQALFLNSKLEDWQEMHHLLSRRRDLWRPTNVDNDLGFSFECPHGPDGGRKLSLDKIRAAEC